MDLNPLDNYLWINYSLMDNIVNTTQSTGIIKYADCISAQGWYFQRVF